MTPQFEQDKGMKSREMPKIKDTTKWWAMMSPKIIRRQREEPEIQGFFSGMIGGQMVGEGISDGLFHSILMMTIAYLLFTM